MWSDVWTVARKELHENLFPAGKKYSGIWQALFMVFIMGIWFPMMSGSEYLQSWIAVYIACFPTMMVTTFAADLFAGERERHTLETLLASRLSDRMILLGKLTALLLYGWTLSLLGQVVAVIFVNLIDNSATFQFFRPGIVVGIVMMTFLVATLMGIVGILTSLRASTIQQASQRMLLPMMALVGLPALVPILIVEVLPDPLQARLFQFMGGAGELGILLLTSLIMLALIGILLAVVQRMFKRARLILD